MRQYLEKLIKSQMTPNYCSFCKRNHQEILGTKRQSIEDRKEGPILMKKSKFSHSVIIYKYLNTYFNGFWEA